MLRPAREIRSARRRSTPAALLRAGERRPSRTTTVRYCATLTIALRCPAAVRRDTRPTRQPTKAGIELSCVSDRRNRSPKQRRTGDRRRAECKSGNLERAIWKCRPSATAAWGLTSVMELRSTEGCCCAHPRRIRARRHVFRYGVTLFTSWRPPADNIKINYDCNFQCTAGQNSQTIGVGGLSATSVFPVDLMGAGLRRAPISFELQQR